MLVPFHVCACLVSIRFMDRTALSEIAAEAGCPCLLPCQSATVEEWVIVHLRVPCWMLNSFLKYMWQSYAFDDYIILNSKIAVVALPYCLWDNAIVCPHQITFSHGALNCIWSRPPACPLWSDKCHSCQLYGDSNSSRALGLYSDRICRCTVNGIGDQPLDEKKGSYYVQGSDYMHNSHQFVSAFTSYSSSPNKGGSKGKKYISPPAGEDNYSCPLLTRGSRQKSPHRLMAKPSPKKKGMK